jgi:hypothetical protein
MKRFGKILLILDAVILLICAVFLLLGPNLSIFLRTGLFIIIPGLIWMTITLVVFDWEYVQKHENWTSFASLCHMHDNHFLAKTIRTGAHIDGQDVEIDIRKIPYKIKYLGRWNVYETQNGVTIYQDNSRLINCWYYTTR